jgi:hypothetical protein
LTERRQLTLLDYVPYLSRLGELSLSDDELRQIPAYEEPDAGGPGEPRGTLGLGELRIDAPSAESGSLAPAGSRQLYAHEREVPPELWAKLSAALRSRTPSGFEKESILSGRPDVVITDEDGRG